MISPIKDRDESTYRQEVEQLAFWCSLNNLELYTLKTVEMIVGFRRNPPCSPPTHHHEQHCDCSGVIQIFGNHHLSGPEVGQSHWLYREKGPAEAVFPPPAKEVQLATRAAETVTFTFTFMHLAEAFIQSDLQCIQAIHFFVSTCVPWESNPQPLRC